MTKEQLYDLFQQILNIKKFEHQLLYNAMQVNIFTNTTKGEGQFFAILLVRLCDIVAPLVLIIRSCRKRNFENSVLTGNLL